MTARLFYALCAPLAFAMAADFAQAESFNIKCNVVLNRTYDVTVDTDTGAMVVTTDSGTRMEGVATRITSSSDTQRYFLATGFGRAVDLSVETTGRQRVTMCLGDSECYLCRR